MSFVGARVKGVRLAAPIVAICLLSFVPSAQAATVTDAGDSGPGSLRQAVADAVGGETIDFAPSVETIDLTSGAIAIDKSLTIDGPGAAELTIDAGHNSRIFVVTDGGLSISGVTLASGAATTDGGAIHYTAPGALTVSESAFIANSAGGPGGVDGQSGRGEGGAIYVDLQAPSPSVSISDSIFTANTAGGDGGDALLSGRGEGGAIADYGGGSLTIAGSTFTDNTVGGAKGNGNGSGRGSGGAVKAMGGGSLSIHASTFTANAVGGTVGDVDGAGGSGGAISTWNRFLIVTGSTFAGNTVGLAGGGGEGGAIDAGALSSLNASASISNSTLTGNSAGGGGALGRGGAIEAADMSSLTLASVTIAANSVGEGGSGAAIRSVGGVSPANAAVTARATIVSGNTGATNCDVPAFSSTYSLEGPTSAHTSCGFHQLASTNPMLQTLADNGGPTETQALLETSPAVGVVPAALCPTSVDQRGEPRPAPGKSSCDVGAYELQEIAPAIISAHEASFQVGKAGSFTFTAAGAPAPSLSKDGALPDGVAFTDNGDGTASLAGTPAAGSEGSWPIAIEAANGISPDATQSFTLMVAAPDPPPDPSGPPPCPASLLPGGAPCPDVPPPGPSPLPPGPIALSLALERKSLGKLLRSGKLVVVARVNRAARLALRGRARLTAGAGRSARMRHVAVFRPRTVAAAAPGRKRVALVLSRQGRRVLRDLRAVRLEVAASARDATGEATGRTVGLTLRR